MNWTIIVALTVALTGGIFLLSRPLPENWRDGEYRRHLTKAEKGALKRGEVLQKTHKAYQDVWKSKYDEGPLRIIPQPNGKYQFKPYGEWKRVTKTGLLQAQFNPSLSPSEFYWREYNPDGSTQSYHYTTRMMVGNDTVNHNRVIVFRGGNTADTAFVQHFFSHIKTNKTALPNKTTFDSQGLRPVPKDFNYNL